MGSSLQLLDMLTNARRGYVGSTWGQSYDVRRLDGSTNVSVLDNAPVLPAYGARMLRKAERVAIENQTFELETVQFVCDVSPLELGDVCTEVGYRADGGIWVIAQNRVTKPMLWVRADEVATITRMPQEGSGAYENEPQSGWTAPASFAGTTIALEDSLTLVDGVYSFAPAASNPTPAAVPIGLQPLNRVRDSRAPEDGGSPTPYFQDHFVAYVPPLGAGNVLRRLDRINCPSGRFEIVNLYTSANVGFVGYIAIATQLAAGTTPV